MYNTPTTAEIVKYTGLGRIKASWKTVNWEIKEITLRWILEIGCEADVTTGHPDMTVKQCAYGHSVATMLNPRGVTTISHNYSLTVARHATVVVSVCSTIHYTPNYNIKIYYLR
jgi:hypothetical protein